MSNDVRHQALTNILVVPSNKLYHTPNNSEESPEDDASNSAQKDAFEKFFLL